MRSTCFTALFALTLPLTISAWRLTIYDGPNCTGPAWLPTGQGRTPSCISVTSPPPPRTFHESISVADVPAGLTVWVYSDENCTNNPVPVKPDTCVVTTKNGIRSVLIVAT